MHCCLSLSLQPNSGYEVHPGSLKNFMVFQVNVVCDWITLTCMQKRHFYREQKYTYVNDYEMVSIFFFFSFLKLFKSVQTSRTASHYKT